MTRAYEEIINFIAAGSSTSDVVDFTPSHEFKERVEQLLARQQAALISPEEASELTHFIELEHIMRLAKARARKRLG